MASSVVSLVSRVGGVITDIVSPFPDDAALIQVPDAVAEGYTANMDEHPDISVAEIRFHNHRRTNTGALRVHFAMLTVPVGHTYVGVKCATGDFGSAIADLPAEYRLDISDDTPVAVMLPQHTGCLALGGMTIFPPAENTPYGIIIPLRFLPDLIFRPGIFNIASGWIQFGHPGFSVAKRFAPHFDNGFGMDILRANRPVAGSDQPGIYPAGCKTTVLPVTERAQHSVISLKASYLAIQNVAFFFPQPRSILFAVVFSSVVRDIKAVSIDASDGYVMTVRGDELVSLPFVAAGNTGSKL